MLLVDLPQSLFVSLPRVIAMKQSERSAKKCSLVSCFYNIHSTLSQTQAAEGVIACLAVYRSIARWLWSDQIWRLFVRSMPRALQQLTFLVRRGDNDKFQFKWKPYKCCFPSRTHHINMYVPVEFVLFLCWSSWVSHPPSSTFAEAAGKTSRRYGQAISDGLLRLFLSSHQGTGLGYVISPL